MISIIGVVLFTTEDVEEVGDVGVDISGGVCANIIIEVTGSAKFNCNNIAIPNRHGKVILALRFERLDNILIMICHFIPTRILMRYVKYCNVRMKICLQDYIPLAGYCEHVSSSS